MLFLLLIIFQCNIKQSNQEQISDIDFNYRVDTLQIKSGDASPVSFLSHVMFDSESIFVGIDPFQHLNTIFLYDLEEKKELSTISVDLNITKTEVRIIGGVSSDSILFASHQSSLIYLINKNGDILKYWDLEKTGPIDYINKHPFFISFFPDSRIIIDDNRDFIFLPIIDDRFHELKGNEKIFHVLRININTDEMELIGFPVGNGKSRNSLFFPDDLSFPQIESVGEELYLTYPYDENIHVFSKDGEFLKTIELYFGQKEVNMVNPMTLETKRNREKAREFRIRMSFFESLKYHSDINLFSRIYHQPPNPDINQKGRSSVYFWDSNFNFVGDLDFGYNEILVFKSIKTSNGYIFSKEVDEEEYLAHKLKLEIKLD